MRKLFVSNVSSLDSYAEDSNKKLDWFIRDEEFFAYARQMLRQVDTILFGRLTYEIMVAHWPTAPTDEIADQMNSLAKVVFSRTLPSVAWNNTRLVSGDPADEVRKLKQQPGKDIVILGSATLASYLLQAGLIDEYRVILTPVLLGRGGPLFPNLKEQWKLKLSKTQTLSSGVVILYYQSS